MRTIILLATLFFPASVAAQPLAGQVATCWMQPGVDVNGNDIERPYYSIQRFAVASSTLVLTSEHGLVGAEHPAVAMRMTLHFSGLLDVADKILASIRSEEARRIEQRRQWESGGR